MSPINITYIILGITAVLLFVIFKYVKGNDREMEQEVPVPEYRYHESVKSPFVDYRDLKFSSGEEKITSDEFDDFVAEFQLDLPKLYKDIMLTSNGGFSSKEYYKGGDARFAPIKYGAFTINDSLNLADFFLEEQFFPFIDNGEYGYAISMNKETLHQIFFWDETGEFVFECDSLQDFLNELDESDDY